VAPTCFSLSFSTKISSFALGSSLIYAISLGLLPSIAFCSPLALRLSFLCLIVCFAAGALVIFWPLLLSILVLTLSDNFCFSSLVCFEAPLLWMPFFVTAALVVCSGKFSCLLGTFITTVGFVCLIDLSLAGVVLSAFSLWGYIP